MEITIHGSPGWKHADVTALTIHHTFFAIKEMNPPGCRLNLSFPGGKNNGRGPHLNWCCRGCGIARDHPLEKKKQERTGGHGATRHHAGRTAFAVRLPPGCRSVRRSPAARFTGPLRDHSRRAKSASGRGAGVAYSDPSGQGGDRLLHLPRG